MRFRWGYGGMIGIAALGLVAAIPAYGLDTIRISSEQWEYATEPDGEGMYWDIFRRVYEPAGIEVKVRLVPYARSIRETMVTDKADAWVASYIDEVPGALYPEWHFDADYVSAAYNAERVDGVNGESSLNGKKVAWMRGYAYDDYLTVSVQSTRVDDRQGGLRMVREDRIDFFIDAAVDLNYALEESGLDQTLSTSQVLELPLYLGFADSERGRQLREIWDRRMPQLLEDGTISRLYREYEWGVWPFNEKYQ